MESKQLLALESFDCGDTFNRTSMESKLSDLVPKGYSEDAFNRTSMESKLIEVIENHIGSPTFNRTSMESKRAFGLILVYATLFF